MSPAVSPKLTNREGPAHEHHDDPRPDPVADRYRCRHARFCLLLRGLVLHAVGMHSVELALDDTAAAGERESAIEAVRRLSNGLITVPDRVYTTAKTAIETVTRKQLTS